MNIGKISSHGCINQCVNPNAPLFLIVFPWIIIILIYCYGPIDYRPLSVNTYLYIFTAFILLVLGYKLGWLLAPTSKAHGCIIGEGFYKIMVVTVLIATILLIFDYYRAGLSVIQTFTNPIENREAFYQGRMSILTTITAPIAFLSPTIFLINLLRLRRRPIDKWTYLGSIPLFGMAIINIMMSGRGSILGILLLFVFYWTLDYCRFGLSSIKSMFTIRNILFALLLIIVVLSYFFYIGTQRHYNEMTLERFEKMWNIDSESIITKVSCNIVGEKATIGILQGFYYYSHQLSALDSIVNADIQASGFGRNIIYWYIHQLSRIGVDLEDNSNNILAVLESKGEFLHGFQTGFNAPIADFGNIGSLFFVLTISIVLGGFFKRAVIGRSEVDQLAAIMLLAGFFHCIQSFPNDIVASMNNGLVFFLLLSPGRSLPCGYP